jgi:tellurite resistance protein TehA-like permease
VVLAHPLWLAGTALQAALALAVISGWISKRAFQQGHLNPAWFIPAVGNVIVPVAGARLGYLEISYLFFAALVQLPRILRLPFALSFRALSFPLAALTIASFLHAEIAQSHAHGMIGTGLLVALVVLIGGLLVRSCWRSREARFAGLNSLAWHDAHKAGVALAPVAR